MIIKNYEELAMTPLRKDALDILEEGYKAINTEMIIRTKIKIDGSSLEIDGDKFDLPEEGKIIFLGMGKCSLGAAKVIEDIFGNRLTEGIVIDTVSENLKKIKSFAGSHPLPSEKNMKAAKEAVRMVEDLSEQDTVITLISGGGSALFPVPAGIDLNGLIELSNELIISGANIREINIVRKHLSAVSGGNLAKIIHPARLISLIFSDVPGDDLSIIASGPTVKDTSTVADAARILKKYGLENKYQLQETPKEENFFNRTKDILLVNNFLALKAMADKAKELGYVVDVYSRDLAMDVRNAGKFLLEKTKSGNNALLAGGETTVQVKSKGMGGRNQETILAALPYILNKAVFISAASDGWDNSDAAGAIGDAALYQQSREKKLDAEKYLEENDSYNFFKQIGGQIITGKTGSNVSDLFLVLKKQ